MIWDGCELGFGVECGVNEALAINPKSGVQEIYTPGLNVVVDALHTLELDGGMECVQVFNKLYKFLFSSSPQEEDVVDVTAPPVWSKATPVPPPSQHPELQPAHEYTVLLYTTCKYELYFC